MRSYCLESDPSLWPRSQPAGKRLLILDTGLSNDHAIFGILRAQIRREPLAAEDRRVKADSCELASDVRCLDGAPEHVGKVRDDFFWGVRRRKHAPPQIDFEAGGFFSGTIETLLTAYVRPRFDGFIRFFEAAGIEINRCLKNQIADAQLIEWLNKSFAERLGSAAARA